jgi:hypothetical protein
MGELMVTTTPNKNLTPQEKKKCSSCSNQNTRLKTCLDNFTPNQDGKCDHYTGKIGQWLTWQWNRKKKEKTQTTKQNSGATTPYHLLPRWVGCSMLQRWAHAAKFYELAQKNKHRLHNRTTRLHQHTQNKRSKLKRNKIKKEENFLASI